MSLNKLLEDQLAFMNKHYEVIAVSSNREKLEEVGCKEGVETFHLEMTRKITPLKDLIAVFKLYAFLKKQKPLIVHTHTPKAGTVGMIAAKMAGVPNRIHTVAGLPLLEVKGIKRKLLNVVEKVTYFCATSVYPNSHGLEQIILNQKFTSKKKLKVIANGSSNGININYFDPSLYSEEQLKTHRKELGIDQDDFVFIFVGRIVKDKGINELVDAFDKLSRQNSKIRLLLVGPLEEELDPILDITKEKIEKNKQIIFVGYQEDVRLFFAASDLLVFPSYREGFPNVVMQAGAMNLPSIVTNINGCNEIIEDGINGKIIPVKNVKALQEAMNYFINSPIEFSKMKGNSRGLICDKFERVIICEALLKEYKKT
jgi:glycosyltransferase involved in cell wall biosynthesis